MYMDPSYNGNFGSFGNGGVTPQQPVVPGGGMPSGNVAPVPSNTQQDIILSPSPEKKSKKWLVIILLLVGLGLVVGVVALVLWKGNIVGSGDITDFKELVSYIEDVPEDYDWSWLEEGDEENGEREWIYAVLVDKKGWAARQDYYKELNNKYEKFLDGSGKRVSAELLKKYKNTITVLENAIDYMAKGDELIAEYDEGNIEGAKKYFDEKLVCLEETDDTMLNTICQSEMAYYDMVLEEYVEKKDERTPIFYRYLNLFSGDGAKTTLSIFVKKINLEILEELNA